MNGGETLDQKFLGGTDGVEMEAQIHRELEEFDRIFAGKDAGFAG